MNFVCLHFAFCVCVCMCMCECTFLIYWVDVGVCRVQVCLYLLELDVDVRCGHLLFSILLRGDIDFHWTWNSLCETGWPGSPSTTCFSPLPSSLLPTTASLVLELQADTTRPISPYLACYLCVLGIS